MKSIVRMHDDIADISSSAWNQLLARCARPSLFMRHEFLLALERSGCTRASTGWQPWFVTLEDGGSLVAACALYLKSHSYGEYVFDWSWADAFERAGGEYYPKLLCAAPFSPVPGTRLLALEPAGKIALLRAIEALAEDQRWSSAHVLFMDDEDALAASSQGWMLRRGVQFHWRNRRPQAYASWEDFMAQLHRDKRKKIAQERRRVREAGISFDARRGADITQDDLDFFHRCYTHTYAAHHATPYLSRDFFSQILAALPEHWLLFVAHLEGRRIASSLIALDPEIQVAYGRYWGAIEHIPCLHFEACYYQPLQWCIEQGWQRFEGGAQGEHKMARGLLPVVTTSAHWLANPGFRAAVGRFLQDESQGVAHYVNELDERNPFKMAEGPGA